MRDGIADYELLCLLAEQNPEAAQRLVARRMLDFDRYDTDVGQFRVTRRELLRLLGKPHPRSAEYGRARKSKFLMGGVFTGCAFFRCGPGQRSVCLNRAPGVHP